MRAQPPDETKQPEQNADPNIEAERIKRRDLETKQDIIAETRPGRNETSYQGDLLPIMSMVLDDFASFGGEGWTTSPRNRTANLPKSAFCCFLF